MKRANMEWSKVGGLLPVEDPKVGLIFPVCDGLRGDERHFGRFYAELTRLGFPFVAHFDHCCANTKFRFTSHPLCCGWSSDDDPKSFFDESFRQRALDVLLATKQFTHMIHMDVDETMEKDAPELIMEIARSGVDVAKFRCLDLWGREDDERLRYRVDGVFQGSRREKVFKLVGNRLQYPHPTAHAPNVYVGGKDRSLAKVMETDVKILHWGIMNLEEAKFHQQRWDEIYTRKVGNNPYGGYQYYFDAERDGLTRLAEVPEEVFRGRRRADNPV